MALYPPKIDEMEYIPLDPPKPPETPSTPSLALQLYNEATRWLGKDPTPNDEVNDEVACAQTLSNLIANVIPGFPRDIPSTATLASLLDKSPHFERVIEYKPGTIIVSPRTEVFFGHCGIFLIGDRIASNDSRDGIWRDNYSFNNWVRIFRGKRDLHIYLWKAKNNGA